MTITFDEVRAACKGKALYGETQRSPKLNRMLDFCVISEDKELIAWAGFHECHYDLKQAPDWAEYLPAYIADFIVDSVTEAAPALVEAFIRYYDWCLNRSPWSHVYITKDAQECFDNKMCIINAHHASNEIALACISARYPSEHDLNALGFVALADAGVPENLAWLLCHKLYSADDGSDYRRLNLRYSSRTHTALNNTDYIGESCLQSFVIEGKLTPTEGSDRAFSEGKAYRHLEAMIHCNQGGIFSKELSNVVRAVAKYETRKSAWAAPKNDDIQIVDLTSPEKAKSLVEEFSKNKFFGVCF